MHLFLSFNIHQFRCLLYVRQLALSSRCDIYAARAIHPFVPLCADDGDLHPVSRHSSKSGFQHYGSATRRSILDENSNSLPNSALNRSADSICV
jgi:hypothetical protein